jgi:hypothetical protein
MTDNHKLPGVDELTNSYRLWVISYGFVSYIRSEAAFNRSISSSDNLSKSINRFPLVLGIRPEGAGKQTMG